MIADEENGVPTTPEVEVETLAEKEPQPAAESAEGEQPEAEKEDPRDRTLKKMQRRIDRITREKLELRAEIERSKAGDTADADTLMPINRESFQTEEEYLDAALVYRQAIREAKEQQEKWLSRRDEIIEEAEESGVDIDKFKALGGSITPQMADAIVWSPSPVSVVSYLTENPDEAKRIAKLPAGRQAAEIGKIEDRLSEAKPRPVKSSAPEPIKPVAGSGKSSTGYRPDMSMAEYAKWRKAQR